MSLTIQTPTLLLNAAIVRRHIARMADKARRSGIRFRPHFKSHQSAAIGEWFREEGVTAITVSSVRMAAYFADHGWDDITIAFPTNWLEIDAINALAARVKLGLTVESTETATFLAGHLTAPAAIWLKTDTGYGRTGILWDNFAYRAEVAAIVAAAPRMSLRGMIVHSGNSYRIRGDLDAIRAVYAETVERLSAARDALEQAGFGQVELSIGDTPTCSVVDDLSAVDEIRTGGFVFYDIKQVYVGSCTVDDVGIALACPVVALHPERSTIVLLGGGAYLSKDFMPYADGTPCYGEIALRGVDGWHTGLVPGCYVKIVSQEHAIVHATPELLARVKVGDVLMVLPSLGCMTANEMKAYWTLDGKLLPMMGYCGG